MTRVFEISLSEPLFYYKAGEFQSGPGWTHKRMHHERDFEVIIGLKGSFELAVDDRPARIGPEDCLVVPPGSTIQGGGVSDTEVGFLWLHVFATWREGVAIVDPGGKIRPDLVGALSSIGRRELAPGLNDLCLLAEQFHLRRPNRVLVLFGQLLDLANRYHYGHRQNDLMAGVVLAELSHDYLTGLVDHVFRDVSSTGPVVEWVRAHMSSETTVASVARQFGVSPDYLSRLFRAEHGVSAREYLIRLKLETAKVLLTRTSLPITEVARYSHFRDAKNFMRLFHDRTSLTPTEYRRAFTATHLNNPVIDPTIPVPQEVLGLIEGESL